MGVLIGNKIAVDWHCKTDQNRNYVHFISRISRNCGTLSTILPDTVGAVYTSNFNSWFLKKFYGVAGCRIVGVKLETETEVIFNDFKFTFEFFDANHNPGAVMILLKGPFGNYLYSGACRYHPKMMSYKSLAPFCIKETLDTLYIDGLYYCENINFPTQDEVIRNAIHLIDAHKNDCKVIFICCRLLGLEKALSKIALEVNEKIYVSKQKYLILKKLGISSNFTRNPRMASIHTIDFRDVTRSKMIKRRQMFGNCITIVMSAVYKVFQSDIIKDYKKFGVFLLPYSDHCSSNETKLMRNIIKSKKVIYLNKYQNRDRLERPQVCDRRQNCEMEVIDLVSEESDDSNITEEGNSSPFENRLHLSEELFFSEFMC